MTRVVVAPAASEDLDELIQSRHLPSNTRKRVGTILRGLERLPERGPALDGQWAGFRFLLGPWPWMLIVYAYDEEADEVQVVTIQDSRSATAVRSNRP